MYKDLSDDELDNLINMGNKFRLGQRCGGKTRMRCGGKTRMRKALGCESRPVKGMRSKLAWGDVVYPYRRNNNFDYWDVIDQEQKANDKGGVTPWTTSNKYDVKVYDELKEEVEKTLKFFLETAYLK